jgi:hypothetical protein
VRQSTGQSKEGKGREPDDVFTHDAPHDALLKLASSV